MADDLFHNRQRTSTRPGILKAEADYASALVPASRSKMQAEIELLCTSKPQHLGCSTSMSTPPLTCDPGRADRVNLPRVLSPHEEATVRCAKARPGSNSSSGSQAPVRSKNSGSHASAQHTATVPFSLIVVALCAMQNSSHLFTSTIQSLCWRYRASCRMD
jgi:hypothetical protein